MRVPLLIAGVLIATMASALAKEPPPDFCHGEFTDMRRIGVTVGDCDVNTVTPKDFKKITDVCGQPWSVGDKRKPRKCSIEAMIHSEYNADGETWTRIVDKVLHVTTKPVFSWEWAE